MPESEREHAESKDSDDDYGAAGWSNKCIRLENEFDKLYDAGREEDEIELVDESLYFHLVD